MTFKKLCDAPFSHGIWVKLVTFVDFRQKFIPLGICISGMSHPIGTFFFFSSCRISWRIWKSICQKPNLTFWTKKNHFSHKKWNKLMSFNVAHFFYNAQKIALFKLFRLKKKKKYASFFVQKLWIFLFEKKTPILKVNNFYSIFDADGKKCCMATLFLFIYYTFLPHKVFFYH